MRSISETWQTIGRDVSEKTHDLNCGECEAPMVLRDSRYGKFYGCSRFPRCRGTIGAHPDGTPLGIPANKATKGARIRAHDVFDRLWMTSLMTRDGAYRWMCRVMDLSEDEAHIGKFTIEQCETLIKKVQERKCNRSK